MGEAGWAGAADGDPFLYWLAGPCHGAVVVGHAEVGAETLRSGSRTHPEAHFVGRGAKLPD